MEPLGRHLVFTAKAVRRRFEERLAEAGGSLPVWAILSGLELGPCRSQHQLAGELHIEGPTLTRQLDRLEAEGLIRRTRDALDRRAIHVETTDAEVRAGLSEREVETLGKLLTKVRSALESAPAATHT